jgi:hypothetical protein
MALIRSKRPEIFNEGATPANLGPGSYDPNVPDFKPKYGVAPFGSTSERITVECAFTPGPGAYDPDARPIRASSQLKPSFQFASKEHRMGRESSKPQGYDVPGPGSYSGDLVKEYVAPKAPRTLHSGSGINWVKVATAPSIPARGQSYGYKEGTYGELVQQPVPYNGYTGTGSDKPGPGHYNASDVVVRKGLKGCSVDMSRVPGRNEVATREPRGTSPGPGSYDVDRAATSHLLRGGAMAKKQSSSFSSTTTRTPLSANMYGPGPGAYKPASTFKSLREHLAANPDTFHAFGSSAMDPRSDPKRMEVPGPGSYNPPLVPKPPANPDAAGNKNSAAFSSNVDRFATPPSVGPGPGGYDHANPSFVDNLKHRINGKFGAFGSTSARLPAELAPAAPPPGTYEPKSDVNPSELRRKDKRSPAFRPSGVREDPSHKTQGAPTFYDVKYDWPKPTSLNPALAGTVPRLQQPKRDEVPGPGKYATPNYLAEKARTTTHIGPSVWAKGERFNRAVHDVPGPGTYNAVAASLVKRSFNITIGDSWE